MADKNFIVKNGLTVGGAEIVNSSGALTQSLITTVPSGAAATTQSVGNSSTSLATTAYVRGEIDALIDSAPGTLNTLDELAAAINDDAAFNTTLTNAVALKAPLASPTFTGNVDVAGTVIVGNNNSIFAENNIRFKATGGSYIDVQAIDQDLTFRTSDTSALDTNALRLDGSNGGQAIFAKGASFSDHVYLADNAKLTLGGGDDLTLYHSSGNSYIKNDTSQLYVLADYFNVKNNANNKFAIRTFPSDAVKLYFNDGEKLATSNTGVTVTGTVNAGATSSVGIGATIADVNTSELGPGYLSLGRDDTATAKQLLFSKNGSIHSYLETSTSGLNIGGANVGIGTSSPQPWAKLEVAGTAGAQTGAKQALYVRAATATANEGVGIRMSAASGSHEAVGIIGMVNNASGNAGSMTFHTYNLGATIPECMRIDNLGNVGIGTTSPSETLSIYASGGANVFIGRTGQTGGVYLESNGTQGNIRNNANEDLVFQTNGATTRMTVGGTGIYTPFHIGIGGVPSSFGSGVSTLVLKGTAANGRAGAINFMEQDGSVTSQIYSTDGSDGYGTVISAAQGDMKFSTGSLTGYKMVILSGGNVGIGTTSPSNPLHVKGTRPARFERAGVGAIELSIDNVNTNSASDLVFEAKQASTGFLFRPANSSNSMIAALSINRDGNVGIGNTSPGTNHAKANKLVVGAGTAGGIANWCGTGEGWYAFSRSNANNTDAYDGGMSYNQSEDRSLKFHTNAGSTRMTVNGVGTVGINVTGTGSSGIFSTSKLHIKTTSGAPGTSGTTQGLSALCLEPQSNIRFDIGSYYYWNSGVWMQTGNTTDLSAKYALQLNPRGGASAANGGDVSIASNGAIPSSTQPGFMFKTDQFYTSAGTVTSANAQVRFINGNGLVGNITTSGSSTAFNTSSDYRLKENVDYTWDATTRLKQLKPARFNWIADDTNTLVDGFLAHEVSSIVPDAITGEKDGMSDPVLWEEKDNIPDGKSVGDVRTASEPEHQQMDHSKLVPLLVKTIQELEARIATLEG